MQTVTLNNGIKIPQLGFGTWKLKPTIEAKRAVSTALEVGYRHIDTARIYLNEGSVGKAIATSKIDRTKIFLTTKLWNTDQKDPKQAFEKSLERLNMDYVDLYLMHYPVTETRLKAWKEMEKIYESGRARSIGVSNFTIKHLKELMKSCNVVPAVNQVEFHPFLFQKELMDFCHKNNIALDAYSPLVHGKKMFVPTITEIAQSHLKTDAQVMLRWNVQHGNIVIPKSKTPSRIQENFNIFDFKLTDEEMATIDGLNENLRTCWDPTDMP